MTALNARHISDLTQRLVAQAAELQEQIEATAEAAAPVELDQTRVGRLSRMDAMQQQQQQKAEQQRAELHLRQIVAALKRIEEDSYGDCQDCEEAIAFERLQARPEALLCINCQAKHESA